MYSHSPWVTLATMSALLGAASACSSSSTSRGEASPDGGKLAATGGAAGQVIDAATQQPARGRAGSVEGGASGGGGVSAAQGSSGHAGSDSGLQTAAARCSASGLGWKTANKTSYTSYPDPGSEECIKFSGCKYAGMFAACDGTKAESWVMSHNIVAIFPDLNAYALHDLCLTKPDNSQPIIVTVYDTCADTDCDGCCTQNRGSADALIDVESYTDKRWGVDDGPIRWADLGPTTSGACSGN
jgi:hypothetical protein